jgi:hypothetical protein
MLEVDAFAEMVMDYVRNLPPEKRPATVSVPEFLKHKMSMMPSEIVKAQKGAAMALRAAGFEKIHMAKGTLWGVPDKVRYFGMNRDQVLGRTK